MEMIGIHITYGGGGEGRWYLGGGDMVLFGLGEWNRWVYFVSLFDFFFFFFSGMLNTMG